MTKSRPLLIAFLAAASAAQAQDPDISHQRQVYREINASAADLEKVSATLPGADGPVSLQGWKENGQLRKITASPGLSGAGFDEFYLEGGQPVFVFSTLKKDGGKAIEDRVYLENGEIVKWLSTDPSFVPHSEDAASMLERLGTEIPRYTQALGGSAGTEAAGGQAVEGVFLGIEQGDYAHWKMRDSKGAERSFFILQTDVAIDRVLADPQEYEGRACRVRWERRNEEIPEAGGRMDIDVLTAVEWP
jgi:hypothetical protein